MCRKNRSEKLEKSRDGATNKYWSTHYVDFTITDEKYHGVSVFVPQDPTTGYYSALNEKIKELSWYYAVGLEVLDKN